MSSQSAWSTNRVPGHLELHSDTLSPKSKQRPSKPNSHHSHSKRVSLNNRYYPDCCMLANRSDFPVLFLYFLHNASAMDNGTQEPVFEAALTVKVTVASQ